MSSLVLLTDSHLISEYVIVDDCSSDSDRSKMESSFPDCKYVWRDEPGHDKSVKDIFSLVKEKYWVHIEDDRPFVIEGDHLTRSLEIFDDLPVLTSVSLYKFHGGCSWRDESKQIEAKKLDICKSSCRTKSGIRYDVPYYRSDFLAPSFRLSPCVHKSAPVLDVFSRFGYPDAVVGKSHEYEFAKICYNEGLLTCHLCENVTDHVFDSSAYKLNDTLR